MNAIKQDVQETGKRTSHAFRSINRQYTCLIAVALLALFTLAAPTTATADTIQEFGVTGTFQGLQNPSFASLNLVDLGPYPSLVDIDITTGFAIRALLVLTTGEEIFDFSPSNVLTATGFTVQAPSHAISFGNPAGFIGFTGGPVAAKYFIFCCNSVTSFDTVLTPFGEPRFTTSEPASICLLGAGLFGLMGMALLRKRAA